MDHKVICILWFKVSY